MDRIGFCMGILLGEGYEETTCSNRDNCAYYVEGFLSRNISHIEDFEQLQNDPGRPCIFYYSRVVKKKRKEEYSDDKG